MSAKMLVRVAPEALVVDAPLAYPPDPIVIDPRPKPVEVVTAADVLERAADLLGEYGWLQREWGSKRLGAFCMGGAMFAASDDLGVLLFGAAADAVNETLDAKRGSQAFIDFNNAPGRTKAEVVAKLRQAARHARGQESGGHGLGAVPRSAGGS